MNSTLSRRKLLRRGTLAGVASVAAIAGCTGPEAATPTETAQSTTSQASEPAAAFESWLPDDSSGLQNDYAFAYYDYASITASQSQFDPGVYDAYTDIQLFERLGLDPGEVNSALAIPTILQSPPPAVLDVAVSESTVVEWLTENGFEADGTIGEYSLYRNDDWAAVGIEGSTLVHNRGPDGVEVFIDADNGAVDRYTAADSGLRAAFDRLDTGTFVFGSPIGDVTPDEADPEDGLFEGQVAISSTHTVDGATTRTTTALAFEDSDAVDTAPLEEYTDGDIFEAYTTVSTSRDGRVAVVTGELPTDEFLTDVASES